MTNGLEFQNKKLAAQLAALDEAQMRRAALAAARQALELNAVESPLVTEALAAADAGSFGDEALLKRLSGLADDIEVPYLTALDKNIVGEPEMVLFRKARAVTALSLAIDADIAAQAGNALYEALHAGVEPQDIARLLAD